MPTLQESATQMITLRPAPPDGYALRAFLLSIANSMPKPKPIFAKRSTSPPQQCIRLRRMGNLEFAQRQFRRSRQGSIRTPSTAKLQLNRCSPRPDEYLRSENHPDKAIAAANAQIAKSPAQQRLLRSSRHRVIFQQKRPRRRRSSLRQIRCPRQAQF